MRVVLLYFLLPLLLLLLVFYWWAQQGQLDPDQLHVDSYLEEGSRSDSDTFSIMTFNIGYLSGMTNNMPVKPDKVLFDNNLLKARELIKKWQPDIIGFQEIDIGSSRSYKVNQVSSLSQGYSYAVTSINWDKKYVPFPYWPPTIHFGEMRSAQAVLSKFQVKQSKRIVLTGPKSAPFYYRAFYLDRLLQVLETSVDGKSLVILNVHLEAFDQETRELQAREVLEVVEQYIGETPLILMGDFNARPPYASETVTSEKTIKMFLEHPLLDVAVDRETYLASESAHFTFDTAEPYEKLDYIFYSNQSIHSVDVHTLTEAGEISDHYPVFMRFKWMGR